MGRLRRRFYVLYILCGALALTACGGPGDRYGDPDSGYPANADRVLAPVDWSVAERVTIRLSGYEFTPENSVFEAGRPYELVLVNDGGGGHTFTAGGFFRAVAVEGLGLGDGESRRLTLESVAVGGGETRILRLVPITAGSYDLTCERPLHDIFGMNGAIRIE